MLLMPGFIVLGHLVWVFTFQILAANISAAAPLTIAGRFGLSGYIILFALWNKLQPCTTGYLRFGNLKKSLKFPLIWWGFKEHVWRFLLIFCSIFIVAAIVFAAYTNITGILLYGILFAAVNSVLEGALWRGFILGRAAEYAGEKQALVLTSLAFGFYHLSLGFSIGICLIFAVGGFYMGGLAIKSRGLFAPVVMQFFVNMAFVSSGIIF